MANNEDLKTLIERRSELFFDGKCKKILTQEFHSSNHRIFVRKTGKIKAYLRLYQSFEIIEILEVATFFEYQNKGYAQELLDYVFNQARKLKVERIFLEVETTNNKAIELYNKNLFEFVRLRKNYYGKDRDAYVLERLI